MKLLKSACVILLLFFSACTAPLYVAVPVDYTAKLNFRPDSTIIILINQFDINQAKITNKKKLDVIKAGAVAAIKFAGLEFSSLPHVKVINLVDSVAFTVNTDSVKLTASKYHANYLLALKSFTADIGLSDIANYTTYYNTNTAVNFVLYESNGIYHRNLNGTAVDAQSEQPYFGLLPTLLIHPTVKGNKQSIKTSAEHATENALQDYFPYTITHNRPLYNDAIFLPAIKEIQTGNFDKADSLLAPFLQDKNPQIASKAAYNLAVVYESEGDIDAAIDLAQQSSDKYNNEFATAILAELKEE
ncbi:DUF6340 family protein [Mucilaginibacter sp.]|uniref:DUF6340 family protein n=1 Tax=Mucilaginibacter sp. TaxID=1882438 RepID=UPI00260C4A04|nr:DUF6340 family protein [Mucilaginibacter sp.]MDB4922683.1 hypothetical protein [Mucilaginibacter sp.]